MFAKMWCVTFILNLIAFSYAYIIQTSNLTAAGGIVDDNSTRIIGGTPTSVEKYPFVVQILYGSQLACGGSLITQWHVLSAAHCFVAENGQQVSPVYYRIRIGSSYISKGGLLRQLSLIVVHESYNSPVRDNDVAVLMLSASVPLSTAVGLATLPTANVVVPVGTPVIILGWGRTNVSVAQGSTVLNEVQVYTVSHDTCAARYAVLEDATGNPFPVTDNMICAGMIDEGGKDACQGDSGGPVVAGGVVVGLTSWGWGCANPLFPGVNTRVASYFNWINSTVYGVAYPRSNAAASLHFNLLLLLAFSIIAVR
ncbi:trypsin, alkaline B-like [Nymphalis io]|uniref:trypsin, alkaline B-like n=1 Tax=Inachis io TaxID=171585 RepID=UPI00216945C8|nr:trypsin, alkaline B-like [Nymphalis io]